MENKLDYQLFIVHSPVDNNKQASDQDTKEFKKTLNKYRYEYTETKKILSQLSVKTQCYSPDKVYSPKSQYSDTVVPDNKKAPPLQGGNSTENDGMWTLQYDISLPKPH